MKKDFGNISKLVMGTLIIGVTITACKFFQHIDNKNSSIEKKQGN